MPEKRDLIAVRVGQADDKNFILATWLRGLYYGDTYFGDIPKSIFMGAYHDVLERLLASPKILVQVACLKDDPGVILGYSVLSQNDVGVTCHWTFVKSAWRGIGIAKSLIPANTNTATHLTKVGRNILKKHPEIVFNPFSLNL